MRRLAPLGLLLLFRFASADRLIDTPTAHRLANGSYHLEYAEEIEGSGFGFGYFDFDFGNNFETTLRSEHLANKNTVLGMDLTYTYQSAVSGLAPGLAFGLQDLGNSTQDGRRAFVCTTYRAPADTINGESATELTLGLYYQNRVYGFVGASLPFSKEVRFLAEDNGNRLSTGFEVKPTRSWGFRIYERGSKLLGSLFLNGRL